MRFLTALSSVILAASGAFCFAHSVNGYDGVVFVLGMAVILHGLFQLIAYGIGFRKSLLPETTLVEGAYSLIFGLLVLANLIPAQHIDSYFAAWFLLSGLARVSQSFAVSKVNPKNWFSVMPLGLVLSVAGFIMLIPNFLADYDILYVIAVLYILDGFSLAIYSIYMIKRQPSQKAEEAKERAKAKKQLAEEKRKERDRKRSMTEAERERERAAALEAKIQLEEEKKIAKEERKASRRPAGEKTMEFAPAETEEIINLAERGKLADELDDTPIEASDLWGSDSSDDIAVIKESARPVFNKPTNIPIIEKDSLTQEKIEEIDIEAKRPIINLEKIEDKVPELELPEIELPEVELKAEGGEAEKRQDYLDELKEAKPKKEKPEDLNNFTPLTLEELFADERFNIKPLTDKRATETDLKLTQTFTFDWLDSNKE